MSLINKITNKIKQKFNFKKIRNNYKRLNGVDNIAKFSLLFKKFWKYDKFLYWCLGKEIEISNEGSNNINKNTFPLLISGVTKKLKDMGIKDVVYTFSNTLNYYYINELKKGYLENIYISDSETIYDEDLLFSKKQKKTVVRFFINKYVFGMEIIINGERFGKGHEIINLDFSNKNQERIGKLQTVKIEKIEIKNDKLINDFFQKNWVLINSHAVKNKIEKFFEKNDIKNDKVVVDFNSKSIKSLSSLRKIVRKTWRKSKHFYKLDGLMNEINLFYKDTGKVIKIGSEKIDYLYIKENKMKFHFNYLDNSKKIYDELFGFGVRDDKKSKYEYTNGKLMEKSINNFQFSLFKTSFIANKQKYLVKEIKNEFQLNKDYSIDEFDVYTNPQKWNNFMSKVIKGEKYSKELKMTSYELIDSEEKIKINCEYGHFILFFLNNKVKIKSFLYGEKNEIFYFLRGVKQNFNFIINDIYQSKRKFPISNFIFALLGLSVLVLLMIFTFNSVFGGVEGMSQSFAYMGNSWNTPWLWIIIFNTFIQVNVAIIVSVIVRKDLRSKGGMKPLFRYITTWVIASKTRDLAFMLTGNHLIAIFIWTLLLAKTMNRRQASVIGAISGMQIMHAIIITSLAFVFVLYGTIMSGIYLGSSIYNSSNVVGLPVIIGLGWFGLFWVIFASTFLPIVFFWKPMRLLWTSILMILYRAAIIKGDYFTFSDYVDIHEKQALRSFKTAFKNKKLVIRLTLIQLFMVTGFFLDAISTFNIISYAQGLVPIGQTGIMPMGQTIMLIGSFRVILKHATDVIPLPGNFYIAELFIKNTSEVVWNFFYGAQLTSQQITQNAANTSFIMRFWSYYIPQIWNIVLVSLAIIPFVIKKIKSTNKIKSNIIHKNI